MVMAKDRLDVLGRILIIYKLNYLKALNNKAIYKQCSLNIYIYMYMGPHAIVFHSDVYLYQQIIFFLQNRSTLYFTAQPFMIFLLVMCGEKKY